ncbi:MAG: hypothetical protein GKR91_11530 [Pseudomonadales bacterium]|nr:hypothetical protein [Pseudomonadales bacterium]
MSKINHIGVFFFAKLLSLIMAIVGLICGILYSFGGFFYELFTSSLNAGTALAFMALVGMPLLFATFGFVAGGVGATLYNLTAKWTGGIESDFKTD